MNIAAFLDGTWNDAYANTNVAQIEARVSELDASGSPQAKVYRPGVGVKRGQRWRGGLAGYGLNDAIERAYADIARLYRGPSDRIYLFGYSRGAFTARSLAGMIARCGIIDAGHMPARQVFRRYRRAQASPGLNEMQQGQAAVRTQEDRLVLERSTLARIRFIGVFDTVGSLGIPGGLARPFNQRRYEFHDTKLSGLVDHARHVVAIDEQRPHYVATLWDGVPRPLPGHETTCVQLWFAGAHANVGGGGTPSPETDNPLSAVTREWMVDEALAAGLALEADPIPTDAWRGAISDSYANFGKGWFYRVVFWRERHLRPLGRTNAGEGVAASVRLRVEQLSYDPKNPGFADMART